MPLNFGEIVAGSIGFGVIGFMFAIFTPETTWLEKLGFAGIVAAGSFAIALSIAVWQQTCLGIFEDEWTCRAVREYDADNKYCRELSWEKCETETDALFACRDSGWDCEGENEARDRCEDSVRCPCMSRHGHDDEFGCTEG